jgi:hypothetical protein
MTYEEFDDQLYAEWDIPTDELDYVPNGLPESGGKEWVYSIYSRSMFDNKCDWDTSYYETPEQALSGGFMCRVTKSAFEKLKELGKLSLVRLSCFREVREFEAVGRLESLSKD